MFERLIDLLIEFAQLFQVFVYVDHYDEAVVLRFGKYHRTLKPGAHWVAPFGIEDLIDVNVKPEPMYLDTQSLHTEDEFAINIQVGLVYEVFNPKAFLLDYAESADQVAMLTAGVVAETVHNTKWGTMRDSNDWLRRVQTRANSSIRVRGAKITKMVVQDLANGDANRLWVEGVEL